MSWQPRVLTVADLLGHLFGDSHDEEDNADASTKKDNAEASTKKKDNAEASTKKKDNAAASTKKKAQCRSEHEEEVQIDSATVRSQATGPEAPGCEQEVHA